MVSFKVSTLNSRGGGNKIEQIIRMINKTECDVVCLQEMHVISEKAKQRLEKICGGRLYRSNGTTQSRGVGTFVRDGDGQGLISKESAKDLEGRILGIEIQHGGYTWSVYNIYAPNDASHRYDFFQEVSKLLEMAKGRLLITGDFNCVLDRHLDRNKSDSKGAKKSDKSKKALVSMIERFQLVDVYRRLYPLRPGYTFAGPNGYRARLDRVYVDNQMIEQTESAKVQAITFSDHDLVSVTIGNVEKSRKWGSGRWAMNTKLLYDVETREELTECIEQFRTAKVKFPHIMFWWDELKKRMKEVLIRNGKRLQNERRKEQRMLESELNMLICRVETTDIETDRIRELKKRLEEMEKEKEEGCRIRSRDHWIDQRENCSRFFYEEEKRKGTLKVIQKVLDEEGVQVGSKEEVCEVVRNFYGNLLTKEDLDESEMEKLIHRHIKKRLGEEERNSMEKIITKGEIFKALKDMSNNKSPGLDGFPREFYAIMWKEIGNDLSDVIANVCLMDKMPASWSVGLVTLIYKEKGNINDLKNWRPITLLNTDYKIMTKVISTRVRNASNNLVNQDQSCGLKNRTIHDQLYYIRNFIEFYNENNKKGLIIALDQEKCFDKIDHRLVFLMLEKYGFGPIIKSLIKTIYHDMTSVVMVNGKLTEPFSVTRSVRQGDSLSMILAVLVGELLAEMIRNNMETTPICLPNSAPKKVAQYADDTSVMTGNHKALNSLWKTIHKYERVTGARINQSKTEILLVGTWPKKLRNEIQEKHPGLVKESVKILGVYFGKDASAKNEDMLIGKVRPVLDKWKDRDLSLKGKVNILRTLVASKIWHSAKVTGLRQKFMSWINKEMSAFIWYPKTYHAISRNTLMNDQHSGGLNFPNVAIELEAYFAESIAIACKHPEKAWVGMTRYRHGETLKDVLPPRKNQVNAMKQSKTSSLTNGALEKLKGTIGNWWKMDYGKLYEKIRENVPTAGNRQKWNNIRNSSKQTKRVDLNFLIAHDRLPLANPLYQRGIAKNDKCGLCSKCPETFKHLFYDCSIIQELKQKLINELRENRINFTLDLLRWHDPKPPPHLSELLSIYKQTIWQTRAAVYYENIKEIKKYLLFLFKSKM